MSRIEVRPRELLSEEFFLLVNLGAPGLESLVCLARVELVKGFFEGFGLLGVESFGEDLAEVGHLGGALLLRKNGSNFLPKLLEQCLHAQLEFDRNFHVLLSKRVVDLCGVRKDKLGCCEPRFLVLFNDLKERVEGVRFLKGDKLDCQLPRNVKAEEQGQRNAVFSESSVHLQKITMSRFLIISSQ